MEVNQESIRIVLVEAHHLLREPLASLLNSQPGFHIVGEAADGSGLLELVSRVRPDVLVMDVQMPTNDPIQSVGLLQEKQPQTAVVVIADCNIPQQVVSLMEAGIAGYVLIDDHVSTLVRAIRAAARGEQWISPRTTKTLLEIIRRSAPDERTILSERELEVLQLVGIGLGNTEIANELDLAVSTVANSVSTLLAKLGLETRVQMALYAISTDLVPINQIRRKYNKA